MGTRKLHGWLISIALAAATAVMAGVAGAYGTVGGGYLVGTVTGNGNPLQGVEVSVATTAGMPADTTVTDTDGNFSIPLPDGDYVVYFSTWDYNLSHPMDSFVSQFYGGGTDSDTAAVVTVTFDADTDASVDLEPGSYISGTVTDDSVPLQDVTVVIDTGDYSMSMDTGADGTYILTGLAPGEYVVEFDPWWWNVNMGSGFVREYYDNAFLKEDATPVTVGAGMDATGIDAELDTGGMISGTVTGGGQPLDSVHVSVRNSAGDWVGSDYSETDGSYMISGLSPDDYQVNFDPAPYNDVHDGMWLSEFYDNATTLEGATPVTVAVETETGGIDADLEEGGGVSGTVTGGGGPLENIRVILYQDGNYMLSAYTDVDGLYDFRGLTPGSYTIEFYAWMYNLNNGTTFLSEYYDDARDSDDVMPVVVSGGVISTGINADLETAGTISGTVTGDGDPLVGVYVYAQNSDGDIYTGAETGANGEYTLGGLPEGDWFVTFDPWDFNQGHATSFLPGYYDGVLSIDDATPVSVLYGEDTPGIDMDLEIGGTISGTVTGGGNPLEEIDVSAYDETTDSWASTYTDGDGNYVLRGLPAGEYIVEFSVGWHNFIMETSFIGEIYDDVQDEADATLVPVTLGEDTGGIDADLAVGASIGGTVTDEDGLPMNGVAVNVYHADGKYAGDSWTDDGSWNLRGLTPGDYVVVFSPADYNAYNDTSYVREYWNKKTSFESADLLTLDYGLDLLNVNAQLTQGGGHIAGTVYRPDGTTPYQDVEIYVLEQTPGTEELTVGYANPAADGSYDIAGLPTGTYRVEFYPAWGGYLHMFYDQKPATNAWPILDSALGTPVEVTDGEMTSNIDAIMQEPASLSGSVEDLEGAGIGGIHVTAWYNDADAGWSPVASTSTQHDGTYMFEGAWDGLIAGEYRVQFTDAHGDLGEAWYLDAATAGDSQTITVEADGSYPLSPQVMPLTVAPEGVTFTPVAGATRIGTAIQVSKQAFPDGASTVIIATGYNWPDALGGSALAGVLDAPMLLTRTDSLPSEVTAEIERLGATSAIILGETPAVGVDVEASLKDLLGTENVERIGGANRYETSLLVAARCVAEQDGAFDGTAFLATGKNFPDQVAAAPLAAGNGWPIYLTNPDHPGDAALLAAMAADGVTDVLVLGSTNAVPADSMKAVVTGVPCTGTRLGGADRYETAKIIASYGVSNASMSWDGLALTTGLNFPDGLTGGVLQGKTGSVLLLTYPDKLYAGAATILEVNKDSITEVRFLGSTEVVGPAVRAAVAQILE